MSQHHYDDTRVNGRPIYLVAGWDRPLAGFFLVIQFMDSDFHDDEFLYSNLSDPELRQWKGLPPTFAHFDAKLASFGITLPAGMRDEVLSDARNNVGNRSVKYDKLGATDFFDD